MNQRFENDEEMLTRGLQALASEMKDLEAPDHVEAKLLEAFRARKVVPISTRRWTSQRYWLAAVAAVLLIAMSVVALRWRSNARCRRLPGLLAGPGQGFVARSMKCARDVSHGGRPSGETFARSGEAR